MANSQAVVIPTHDMVIPRKLSSMADG